MQKVHHYADSNVGCHYCSMCWTSEQLIHETGNKFKGQLCRFHGWYFIPMDSNHNYETAIMFSPLKSSLRCIQISILFLFIRYLLFCSSIINNLCYSLYFVSLTLPNWECFNWQTFTSTPITLWAATRRAMTRIAADGSRECQIGPTTKLATGAITENATLPCTPFKICCSKSPPTLFELNS